MIDGVEFKPEETRFFFFTVEFSDDPTTYYRNVRSIGKDENDPTSIDKYYYVKDPEGTSNVYQDLEFKLNQLVVRRM